MKYALEKKTTMGLVHQRHVSEAEAADLVAAGVVRFEPVTPGNYDTMRAVLVTPAEASDAV